MRRIDDLLQEAIAASASDIHLAPGRPPFFRISGVLQPITQEALAEPEVSALIKALMDGNQRALTQLKEDLQTDFSYALADGTRFRVNIYRHREGVAAAIRLIPNKIKTIEELGLPSHILQFAEAKQGFLLAVGPTGEGKSTTLAALIQHINQYRAEHIITIEDPIEYMFPEIKSIIDQREIGRDAISFPHAIRATLRQDPDVILIGELRDRESMQTALTLAETGQLVFTTLHTNDAAQTIERIIDSFPPNQQPQIKLQLAATISGVISQRLLPAQAGGRVATVEIMIATPAIRNAIREGKTHQILGMIQTGGEFGMQTLDNSLRQLVAADIVSEEVARPYFMYSETVTGKRGRA
ncbi:MAG: type IV pili twitching motility protein PilT [Candidatus Andersenbacteria bacterium CG10_big_fil_rev_8_21_14_0_10_54_11]|uniref:Type IV pili twitching motility protein PilT n=1 Tax=Candidatus Andersenbacteria bacterium CG10_big_fil_rev_8_21_14_0_10_54_11 TaxID=1974485 RepID=A0A2M6WY68_9BACT|nr:MAG: type IV pili twitching motility protein PilT [Candidatus Andersenbacteria bacterium CG10_big_fil_rev_8_21_14_0_10_54_11]